MERTYPADVPPNEMEYTLMFEATVFPIKLLVPEMVTLLAEMVFEPDIEPYTVVP
jgi:hypothetical protein